MNITYVHQYFRAPTEAGSGRPYEFAKRLAERGHSVTMVCAGNRDRVYSLDGFTVRQVATKYDNDMSIPRRLLAFLIFMLRATRVTMSTSADAVLASSTPLTVVIPGALAARWHRARFVFEVRDLWPEAPIQLGLLPKPLRVPARILEWFGYQAADHVIALSPGMAEGVRRRSSSTPITVIPNASDLRKASANDRSKARAALGIPDDQLLFVYVGSLGRIYQPIWLAELAIVLAKRDAHLIVVGRGSEQQTAMNHLLTSGLNPLEVFVGPLPRQQVPDLLAAADVAVSSVMDHPTLRHASINKIFDALGAGLPVLMNHDGWLSELVVAAGAGVSIQSPEDVDLTFDATWRNAASDSARALAEERFSREALFEQFHEVLVDVSS